MWGLYNKIICSHQCCKCIPAISSTLWETAPIKGTLPYHVVWLTILFVTSWLTSLVRLYYKLEAPTQLEWELQYLEEKGQNPIGRPWVRCVHFGNLRHLESCPAKTSIFSNPLYASVGPSKSSLSLKKGQQSWQRRGQCCWGKMLLEFLVWWCRSGLRAGTMWRQENCSWCQILK